MHPFKTICKNAEIETSTLSEDMLIRTSSMGYDTRTGKVVDMFEAGIIDPANVTLNSIRNALSVASAILTTDVIIQIPRPDITEQLVHSILSKNQPQ